MIGWYHTGPKLRASDQEINDLLKRYIAKPVMVIVDVRPETVGIPTDAYFAVEEIKDVCGVSDPQVIGQTHVAYRMARRPARRSFIVPRRSKRKKRRRSVLSTCCGTSRTQQRPHYQRVSRNSSHRSADSSQDCRTSRNTSRMWQKALCLSIIK